MELWPAPKLLWLARVAEAWVSAFDRQSNLLWVREHGVWPSHENLHLYYLWRRSHSCPTLLEQSPAHLLLDFETEDCISLVYMASCFGWGYVLVANAGRRVFNVDHDGHVWATSPEPPGLSALSPELLKSAKKK